MSLDVSRLLAGAARTVGKLRYCWLVTGSGSEARMRPMGHLPRDPGEDEWTMRFVTDGRSRKAADMERSDEVTLIFHDESEDGYVALIGRARLRRDRSEVRSRWKPVYNIYFPTEVDRANAIFVEVAAERLELWIRGVTPEPFGMHATRLDRDPGGNWRLGR